MPTFLEKLDAACAAARSLVCVGLDPDPALMPLQDVFAFNKAIVDATQDLACAYKPNLAFYEALGLPGWRALEQTIAHIRRAAPKAIVIGDAKRGDIGSTSEAYAKALFQVWGLDAATVNAYGGKDSIEPFLSYADKGVLIWCRSSNPGARDFQDLVVSQAGEGAAIPRPFYEAVAERAMSWNDKGNVGLVLGATYPTEIRRVRKLCPGLPFLLPGTGAQEGALEQAVRFGVDAAGRRAIINSSRGVIYASKGRDFPEAARRAATQLRDAINAALAVEGKGW
ncbi:MAG: orotidine-5'-phosphate decarboxylase [Chloroflexi bacterium]|nr:orotidine-5'-phosphate decarboxylase [Chloroflexota bacterium]